MNLRRRWPVWPIILWRRGRLQSKETKTAVTRTFELHPQSTFKRPFLWIISLFLRQAIDRHLDLMAAQAARRF